MFSLSKCKEKSVFGLRMVNPGPWDYFGYNKTFEIAFEDVLRGPARNIEIQVNNKSPKIAQFDPLLFVPTFWLWTVFYWYFGSFLKKAWHFVFRQIMEDNKWDHWWCYNLVNEIKLAKSQITTNYNGIFVGGWFICYFNLVNVISF